MTLRDLGKRLDRIEVRHGLSLAGDPRQMTDRQLRAVIHDGYARLRAEHGSLAAAIRWLREFGNEDDETLADLMEEDLADDPRQHQAPRTERRQ